MTSPPQQQQAPPSPGKKPTLLVATHATSTDEKDKSKAQAGHGIAFGLPELEKLNVGRKVPKDYEQRSDVASWVVNICCCAGG